MRQSLIIVALSLLLVTGRVRAEDATPAPAATPVQSSAASSGADSSSGANALSSSAAPAPAPSTEALTSDAALQHRARVYRRTGIGLMIGSGVLLALGGLFVGLAKGANNDATAGGFYHPDAKSRRDAYEVADTTFFWTGATGMATGLILFLSK